jgi:hypothetical protein
MLGSISGLGKRGSFINALASKFVLCMMSKKGAVNGEVMFMCVLLYATGTTRLYNIFWHKLT